MPLRDVRHQAAIVRDHHILLLHVRDDTLGRSFWILPGGGREGDESDEECVRREVREETGLDVTVDRLLVDEILEPNHLYERVRTYLCVATDGAQPTPGVEPEVLFLATILETRWFDLRSLVAWDPEILANPHTMRWIHAIRPPLGYA